MNVPFTEAEVEQVVRDVAENGIIRGTKEYNKDEYVGGAKPADSSHAFPPWTEGGKVFYKVRLQALDPRNFKDAGDVGTLAVRYVLQPQGDKNTVCCVSMRSSSKISATRCTLRTARWKGGWNTRTSKIHLDSIEVMKQQTAEAEKERLLEPPRKRAQPTNGGSERAAAPPAAPAPAEVASARTPAGVANAGPTHEAQASNPTPVPGSAVQSATQETVSPRSRRSEPKRTRRGPHPTAWPSNNTFKICGAKWSDW